jgi:hypothetical protein
LNVVAAIALAKELGPDKTVVTVAVDTALKYLNGNLLANVEVVNKNRELTCLPR